MKKWFAGAAIFLVVYLIFAIASMPASFVLNFVKLPNNIALQGVSGSVWQARVKQIQHQYGVVNDINASLSFISLLSANPRIELAFGGALVDGPEGYATIDGLLDSPTLTNTQVIISAADIAPHLDLIVPVDARGYIEANISQYTVGQPFCQALNGSLTWPNAEVYAVDQQIKFGNLSAKLACSQGAIEMKIDEGNNLGLSYSAYLQQGGRISGNGYIKPGANFPAPLNDALAFLGQPDNQGRYRLRF